MNRIGCCMGVAEACSIAEVEPVDPANRLARGAVGALFIASAGVLFVWPLALLRDIGVPVAATWPLGAAALWFGLSHLVAAATAYRGCPEIGAIPSLLLRRHVETTCRPWERADRRIGGTR